MTPVDTVTVRLSKTVLDHIEEETQDYIDWVASGRPVDGYFTVIYATTPRKDGSRTVAFDRDEAVGLFIDIDAWLLGNRQSLSTIDDVGTVGEINAARALLRQLIQQGVSA